MNAPFIADWKTEKDSEEAAFETREGAESWLLRAQEGRMMISGWINSQPVLVTGGRVIYTKPVVQQVAEENRRAAEGVL